MSVCLFTKYCVDTSALINLYGRQFPVSSFPDLFTQVDAAFKSGLLVSTREVRHELQNGSAGDGLKDWATAHPDYFVDPDERQIRLMTELLQSTPEVYDAKLLRDVDADPWVIVVAQAHSLAVVTSESPDSTKKIPAFCRQLGIAVFAPLGFFAEEGWAFTRDAPHGSETSQAAVL